MNGKQDNLATLHRTKIIAIVRARQSRELLEVVEAIHAGGVRVVEIAMNTPGALEIVAEVKRRLGEKILVGAGTVLDSEAAAAAIRAGAQFVLSPVFRADMIAACRRYGCIVIPGALTPTEILAAWESGADLVKVFPTSQVGPSYIKAIKAPLPQVDLVAVGGVDQHNAAEFIAAGCAAVGVGSALISPRLVEQRDFEGLKQRAEQFVRAVASSTTA